MTANIAICAKMAKMALYPDLAHASVSRRHIAAADRARVHAHGPRTGGDEPAASQPLPPLPRPSRQQRTRLHYSVVTRSKRVVLCSAV